MPESPRYVGARFRNRRLRFGVVSALRGGKKTKLAGKELLDFKYINIHVNRFYLLLCQSRGRLFLCSVRARNCRSRPANALNAMPGRSPMDKATLLGTGSDVSCWSIWSESVAWCSTTHA